MITKFKLYENKKPKIGDYVVYDHDMTDEDSENIVIRKDVPYEITNVDESGNIYYLCDDGIESGDNFPNNGYEIISKEEAQEYFKNPELYKNMKKYNL